MTSNLDIAIRAAIEGGKAIMEVYATDFEVETKSDESPLTLADEKANDVINSYLATTPIPIISEENKEIDYEVRKNWDSCWIVDPLDGTKEFVKRNGEFTVNIALINQGIPTLGVIYVPVSRVLYFTSETLQTSYRIVLEDVDISVENIKANAVEMTPSPHIEPLKVVGSRSHLNAETELFIKKLTETKTVEIVSKGSSLKFCLVAEGAAHIYPRFAPTMEWDTAAGHAICKAVGIDVIDQETQKPLLYNKANLLNPHFLVS